MLFFLVLWPLVRLAMPFAPRSKNFRAAAGLSQQQFVRKLRVRCTANLFAPAAAHRTYFLPSTQAEPHPSIDYLCGEFEEHSLLASVLQPLACPSSQYCNSARSPRTQLPAIVRDTWIITRPDAAVAPIPKARRAQHSSERPWLQDAHPQLNSTSTVRPRALREGVRQGEDRAA